jgi:hypothetical protein
VCSSDLTQMSQAVKDRNESVEATLQVFIDIMEDEHKYMNVWRYKSLRTGIRDNVHRLMRAAKEQDPVLIHNFEVLIQQCELLKRIIVLANQQGAKII